MDNLEICCAWCGSTDVSCYGASPDNSADYFTCRECKKDTQVVYDIVAVLKKE